ncbi:MAG: hypothetical protein ACLGIN_09835 [Candidatus Sericytochromatia bacterium]
MSHIRRRPPEVKVAVLAKVQERSWQMASAWAALFAAVAGVVCLARI